MQRNFTVFPITLEYHLVSRHPGTRNFIKIFFWCVNDLNIEPDICHTAGSNQSSNALGMNYHQSQNVDFKTHMIVKNCFVKDDNGNKVSVRCSDWFRIGKNNNSGCGCKNFECVAD